MCNFLSDLSRYAVATSVAEELHGVTCYLCNLSRNIFVARSVARSRTQSYFFQRLQQLSITVAQCNTPPATCVAMLCSISQSGSLLSSPRSSSDSLVVPLHSVTPCSWNCNDTLLNVARQVAQKIAFMRLFPVRLSHSSCDVLSLLWKLQKLLLLLLLFCS